MIESFIKKARGSSKRLNDNNFSRFLESRGVTPICTFARKDAYDILKTHFDKVIQQDNLLFINGVDTKKDPFSYTEVPNYDLIFWFDSEEEDSYSGKFSWFRWISVYAWFPRYYIWNKWLLSQYIELFHKRDLKDTQSNMRQATQKSMQHAIKYILFSHHAFWLYTKPERNSFIDNQQNINLIKNIKYKIQKLVLPKITSEYIIGWENEPEDLLQYIQNLSEEVETILVARSLEISVNPKLHTNCSGITNYRIKPNESLVKEYGDVVTLVMTAPTLDRKKLKDM